MSYEVVAGTPTAAQYLHLRRAGGLSPFTEEAAKIGLAGSFHCVVVKSGDETIGMGRIIGDGGCFFQIVDIVVERAHQRQGLGAKIMSALMAHLETHAPKSAYISLLADVPADRLYARFGFKPTAPRTIGMAIRRE